MEQPAIAKRCESIQLMRGMAALSVVIFHIGMFANGRFGVDLFFCISGFIMMYTTEKSSEKFLLKRAVRIVPLYWAAIAVTSAMLLIAPQYFRSQELSAAHVIRSMLFIPSKVETNWSIVAVGWTLILEVFFYVIFYISMKISFKNRHIISGAVLILTAGAGQLLDGKTDSVIVEFYCRPVILEFVLGMLLYTLLSGKKKKTAPKKYDIALLILAGMLWLFLFGIKYIPFPDDLDRFYKYGIVTFFVFLLTFKYFENRKIPRPFIFLGDISYSLYLTHTFIVQPFSRLIYNIDDFTPLGAVLSFFIVIPLCIFAAWICKVIIEDKFTAFLRAKLNI